MLKSNFLDFEDSTIGVQGARRFFPDVGFVLHLPAEYLHHGLRVKALSEFQQESFSLRLHDPGKSAVFRSSRFTFRTNSGMHWVPSCRGVAQPGSAPALGAGGRWFESSRPDHFKSPQLLFSVSMAIQSRATVMRITILLGCSLAGQASATTFNQRFAVARESFLQQHHQQAVEQFQALEVEFAREPEFRDSRFQQVMLPMYGVSALFSGQPEMAVQVLNRYLDCCYEAQPQEALILIALIQATRQAREEGDLDALYRRFLDDFPQHPERSLMRFERMITLLSQEREAEALEELRQIESEPGSADLKARARVAALQHHLNRAQWEQGATLLFERQWKMDDLPEQAVLAFSALQLGDYFMAQQAWQKALRAYAHVPLYTELVSRQKSQLTQLQTVLASAESELRANANPMWRAHYHQLQAQMQARLSQLEQGEDYTPVFLLKRGRCHLFASHFTEAWVIFRSLALAELDVEIREQAWYHWILASHGFERWREARQLCEAFANHFPDSALLPKALYLLARTYQEAGEAEPAIKVLSDLIERFPEHRDRSDWWVTRGNLRLQVHQLEHALSDLDYAIALPDMRTSLRVRAAYWRILVLGAMNAFDRARASLLELLATYPDHWMAPEFQYRLGRVEYSSQRLPEAKQVLTEFLNDYPDHASSVEARVLLGDIAMADGELELAVQRFQSILPEHGHWYRYAKLQIGKVLRAMEDYAAMELHFRSWLNEEGTDISDSAGEILYWLGWALQQQQRAPETLQLYLDALDRWANDPAAGGITEILNALPALYELLRSEALPEPVQAVDGDWGEFCEAESFGHWIEAQKIRATEAGRLTEAARLQGFQALQLRWTQQQDLARRTLQEISLKVPMDALDDLLLGEIGFSLIQDGFEAGEPYLRELLQRYPRSASRALAFLGMGRRAVDEQRWQDANHWLIQFQRQTPQHERRFEAQLLHARILQQLGQRDQCKAVLEEILRSRDAGGHTQVLALQALAEWHVSGAETAKAIAYYQRIYTLHRAERELVAEAYARSAQLFEERGDLHAALRTWQELLSQEDLVEFPQHREAAAQVNRLQDYVSISSGTESLEEDDSEWTRSGLEVSR